MLKASCNNLSLEQGVHPKYHNKDTPVSNLCLLFKIVHEVYINPRHGTLKDWINEAIDEIYLNQII